MRRVRDDYHSTPRQRDPLVWTLLILIVCLASCDAGETKRPGPLAGGASAGAPRTEQVRARPSQKEIEQDYQRLLATLGLWRRPDGLPSGNTLPIRQSTRKDSTRWIVGGGKYWAYMEFDLASGALRLLDNEPLRMYVYDRGRSLMPNTIKAKLTGEQATERARAYLCTALGALPSDVRDPPSAKFYEEGGPDVGNTRGRWWVTWRRQLGPYLFQNDIVDVGFLEEYGLVAIGDHRDSDVCPIDPRVPKEDALRLALDAAKRVVPRYRSIIPSGNPGEPYAAELMIVNPNGVFDGTMKDAETAVLSDTRGTRLAWVVRFKGFTHPFEEDRRTEPVDTMIVWIDAQTGMAIGGDFCMHPLR